MVDQARRVDVEQSMNQREWSTEEFHQVLLAHTDMVINPYTSICFCVILFLIWASLIELCYTHLIL